MYGLTQKRSLPWETDLMGDDLYKKESQAAKQPPG